MSLYSHFAIDHALTELAEAYRILAKVNDEPIVTQANKKILEAYEELLKVSDAMSQQLEERR